MGLAYKQFKLQSFAMSGKDVPMIGTVKCRLHLQGPSRGLTGAPKMERAGLGLPALLF